MILVIVNVSNWYGWPILTTPLKLQFTRGVLCLQPKWTPLRRLCSQALLPCRLFLGSLSISKQLTWSAAYISTLTGNCGTIRSIGEVIGAFKTIGPGPACFLELPNIGLIVWQQRDDVTRWYPRSELEDDVLFVLCCTVLYRVVWSARGLYSCNLYCSEPRNRKHCDLFGSGGWWKWVFT